MATADSLCASCLYRSGVRDKDSGKYWCAKICVHVPDGVYDCTGYLHRQRPVEADGGCATYREQSQAETRPHGKGDEG